MSTKIYCNVCNREIKPGTSLHVFREWRLGYSWGVHGYDSPDALVSERPYSDEYHICNMCIDAVSKLVDR